MINRIRFYTIFLFCLLTSTIYSQNFSCTIKGEIKDTECKHIHLVKFSVLLSNGVLIPVNNNRFEYTFKFTDLESYCLVLETENEDNFMPVFFFPDNDTIEFTLYPRDKYSKNSITGSDLSIEYLNLIKYFNNQFESLYHLQDSLRNSSNLFTPEFLNFRKQIDKAKNDSLLEKRDSLYHILEQLTDNEIYTAQGLKILNKIDSVSEARIKWHSNYIKSNRNIFAYSLLFQHFRADIFSDTIYYQDFANQYPNHPYTQKIENILIANKSIKIGSKYINFEASDLNGNSIKISDLIENKVSIIDLWSSWCGPCRRNSKSIIPIYEKYKNYGFTVVGIAREFNNIKSLEIALEKDNYPWINLIELDDKNNIWYKYGIENSAGSTYLIDSNGLILAINPSADEIDKILAGIFKID